MSDKELEQVNGGQIEPPTNQAAADNCGPDKSKRDLDRLYGKAPVIELAARRPEFNRE